MTVGINMTEHVPGKHTGKYDLIFLLFRSVISCVFAYGVELNVSENCKRMYSLVY